MPIDHIGAMTKRLPMGSERAAGPDASEKKRPLRVVTQPAAGQPAGRAQRDDTGEALKVDGVRSVVPVETANLGPATKIAQDLQELLAAFQPASPQA